MMQPNSAYSQGQQGAPPPPPPHPQQIVGLPQIPPPPASVGYGGGGGAGGPYPGPAVSTGGGGYTLPPTGPYFPMSPYNAAAGASGGQQCMTSSDAMTSSKMGNGTSDHGSSMAATTQPNTPDLLIHRRQVGHYLISFCPSKKWLRHC